MYFTFLKPPNLIDISALNAKKLLPNIVGFIVVYLLVVLTVSWITATSLQKLDEFYVTQDLSSQEP